MARALTVVVTGAAGFVGAAVCAELEGAGHTVVRAVRTALPEYPDAVVWDLCDDAPVSDPAGWASSAKRGRAAEVEVAIVDVVVHCAASPGTTLTSGSDALAGMRELHVHGTRRAWDAWPNARFVLVSTASVYPPGSGRPTVEADALAPNQLDSDYARTKAEAEQWLLRASAESDRPCVILRPSAIYGPGDRHVLPRLRRLVRGRWLLLPDGGRHAWSVTHIDTIALACRLAAESKQGGQLVLSVADEPVVPFGETLQRELEADAGRPLRPVTVPGWLLRAAAGLVEAWWNVARRPGEPLLSRGAVAYVTQERVLDVSAWQEFQNRAR